MTTGFGFCAQCGTPRIAAEQRFCAGCGTDLAAMVVPPPVPPVAAAPPALPVAAPPAAPALPTQAAPQPAAEVPSQPPTPPAWSVAPAQSYPAAYTAPGVPAAPAAPSAPIATVAGIKVTPKLLAIGGIALAVVVGAYLFMSMNSKGGSITFNPAALSCSKPVSFTTTAKLPASVHVGDMITIRFDGKSIASSPIGSSGSDEKQQPDGSWISTSTTSSDEMQTLCAAGGSAGGINVLTPGTHTMQVLDASGKVLAEGSYTVTP
jgi:hypothetical protein